MKKLARPNNSLSEQPRISAAFRTAARTPWIGSSATVEALVISQLPSVSSTRRSVNVPPVSHERRTVLTLPELENLTRVRRCGHLTSKVMDDVDSPLYQRGIAGREQALAHEQTVLEPHSNVPSEYIGLSHHRPDCRGDAKA